VNQKRRVIFVDDETWTGLQAKAGARGVSVSAFIRESFALDMSRGKLDEVSTPPGVVSPQAQRDEWLRKMK
jgi:hypothetical protein